jgi:hypothetical protein
MRFGEHFVTTETLYLLRSILRQGRLVMPGETVEIARGVACSALRWAGLWRKSEW